MKQTIAATALCLASAALFASSGASSLSERVAADFAGRAHPEAFAHYAVPPMSHVQRLPDAYPTDGQPSATVRIVAAKDEYEPGSILLYPFRDADAVQPTLTPFKTADGKVFPAADLDLTVVKNWYQNGNAWYSYFGDTGRKLVPELLLHDENLIRVDMAKEANYARLTAADGKVTERWLNPPRQIESAYFDFRKGRGSFQPMRRNFCDAETIRPIALVRGQFKNLMLTAHVRATTPAGLYRGAVLLGELGEVPVTIRVLDFTLPKPACYFDDQKPFLVNFYTYSSLDAIMDQNGGDLRLAIEQFKAVAKDYAAHNQDVFWMTGAPNHHAATSAQGAAQLAAIREAGFSEESFCGAADIPTGPTRTEAEAAARRSYASIMAFLGPKAKEMFVPYGDEPPPQWLMDTRARIETAQRAGFKMILAGSDNVFRKAAYQWDWHNVAKVPEEPNSTRAWNLLGGDKRVAWYANQHVGAEDPALNRRQNGMAAYLSNYAALCNYAHHFGPYNDDSETYRPMVYAYGQGRGVIDTLQWEGFREGVDDIRYATLMVRLAREAAASGPDKLDARYAGMKALQYLAAFNRETDDLDACRTEMIVHIQTLKKVLGK